MALSPILQAVAEALSRDQVAIVRISGEIQEAAESGPWRYSPEEVAEMWSEIVERASDVQVRQSALESVYHPWTVVEVYAAADEITFYGLS